MDYKIGETYSTTDIVLAAFLRLSGCSLKEILKQGQKGTFIFENVSEDLVKIYDFGTAQVEPATFNQMIKTLTTAVRRMD